MGESAAWGFGYSARVCALEMKFGLIAGGIADLGGLMVLVSLVGMLVGIFRYSGTLDTHQDAMPEGARMIGSRRILIFGGLALAAFGMLYGLHYAFSLSTRRSITWEDRSPSLLRSGRT